MDLDQMYEAKQDAIFKDFMTFGWRIWSEEIETVIKRKKELVENDLAGDSIIKEKVMDKDKVEVIIDENLNLSQVWDSSANIHDP